MHEAITPTTHDNVVKNDSNFKTTWEPKEPKPQAIIPITANIPESIRGGLNRWVLWRYELAGLKADGTPPEKEWTKPPYQGVNPQWHASVSNPSTWTTYITVERNRARFNFDGVGLVLTNTNITGLDYDNCRDKETGVIRADVLEDIALMDTYWEISPSKKGVRILCYGEIPQIEGMMARIKKDGVEIYDKSSPHFLTMTGDRLPGTPTDLQHRQKELAIVHARRLGHEPGSKPTTNGDRHKVGHVDSNLPMPPSWVTVDDVIEALKSASNSDKFNALFSGDMSAYRNDASSADQALLSLVKFYAAGNFPLCIEVMRRTKLVRDKWDRADYLERTWRSTHMETTYSWPDYRPRDVEEDVAVVVGAVVMDAPKDAEPDKKSKKPTKEETASGYDRMAAAFVQHSRDVGRTPLYIGGRFYRYDENRYVESDELAMDVRQFFKSRGWARSNNVIGNVVENIKADCRVVGRELPFWNGYEDQPFSEPKNVIAFANGLLDTAKPETILPHSPDWCSTVCLPFAHDPLATCPTWLRFLNEALESDSDRIALVQEFFGYCLTCDTSLQKALVLVGKPRSGKGTIQKTLRALVGEHNATGFSLDSLTKDFGLSSLVSSTVALVGEVELQTHPQKNKIVEILKSIIGEDEVAVNVKHDPHIRSRRLPTRFVIASNTVPRLMESSGALHLRLLFVPFEISFAGREDFGLEGKLLTELPGIANWALEGLGRLRANKGRFTLGTGHKALADQYATDTSPVMAWLRDRMIVSRWANPGDLPDGCLTPDTLATPKNEVYACYQEWCDEHDLEAASLRWFARDLLTLLPKLRATKTMVNGFRVWSYSGIGKRR